MWIRSIVEEWIGCTPAYWTVFLDNSSLDTNLDGCLPEQYEYIRKEILWSRSSSFGQSGVKVSGSFGVFNNASRLYVNPCSTMQKSVVNDYDSYEIRHAYHLVPGIRKLLDVADLVSNHHSLALMQIMYKGNSFMEIKNSQAYNEETWLSQTG